MTQLERYIYLIDYWQSKIIEYKSMHEMAERQLNFYQQKMKWLRTENDMGKSSTIQS